MKIYDISQEVFSSEIYPGDPSPRSSRISDMTNGDLYNLSSFSMCTHNGTHIDAPLHFLKDGKSIDKLDLYRLAGRACVVSHSGELTAKDAEKIIARAKNFDEQTARRILIKGQATVTEESAEVFRDNGAWLIGVESQSVGPVDAPMAVHKILLEADVILLEGLRLGEVPDGNYLLSAAPLNLAGLEGSPCRAILFDI